MLEEWKSWHTEAGKQFRYSLPLGLPLLKGRLVPSLLKRGRKVSGFFFSHQSVEGDWGLIRGRGPSREEEKKKRIGKEKIIF